MSNTKSDALAFTKALLMGVEDQTISKDHHEPKSKLRVLEGDTQSSILDWLDLQEKLGKLFYQRVNNTPIYDAAIGKYRKLAKGVKPGFPDIYVLKDGKSIFLEVKSNDGDQSKDQKTMQFNLEKHGAEYYVVRSLTYVMKLLS